MRMMNYHLLRLTKKRQISSLQLSQQTKTTRIRRRAELLKEILRESQRSIKTQVRNFERTFFEVKKHEFDISKSYVISVLYSFKQHVNNINYLFLNNSTVISSLNSSLFLKRESHDLNEVCVLIFRFIILFRH